MSMKDGPFKRAYLQIGGATGWAPVEKVWELLKHTFHTILTYHGKAMQIFVDFRVFRNPLVNISSI